MYPAHTQLLAKWSSPSIGDRRATGCKKRRDMARRELEEEEEHGGEEGQGSDQSFASDDGLLLTWEEDDLE